MSTTRKHRQLALIHGPNLNLLGTREATIYGRTSLTQINNRLTRRAKELELKLHIMQTNHEGEMIDFIQQHHLQLDGLIINPAALGHTSIALRDTLLATDLPFVEVHLSNIYAREDFRRQTRLQDIALAVIAGCGANGYSFALENIASALNLIPQEEKTSLSTEISAYAKNN